MPNRGAWSSPRWIKYSRAMRRLHPWCSVKAKGCTGRKNLQVHHLTYPPRPLPVWVIAPWYLVVTCRSCHNKITQKHRGKVNKSRYTDATIAVMGAARFHTWKIVNGAFWAAALGVPALLAVAFALRVALASPQ